MPRNSKIPFIALYIGYISCYQRPFISANVHPYKFRVGSFILLFAIPETIINICMYNCICSTIQIYSPFMPFIMSPFFITVNPVNNFRSCTVENFSRTLISILYVYYSDKNYFAAVLKFSLLECSIFMQSRRNRATRATLDFTTCLCKGFIAHSSYLSALNFCNSPGTDFFSLV